MTPAFCAAPQSLLGSLNTNRVGMDQGSKEKPSLRVEFHILRTTPQDEKKMKDFCGKNGAGDFTAID